MLEQYFVLPATVDRIRSSWISAAIESYVGWLTQRGYRARTVYARVPVLVRFGEFAAGRGATSVIELPEHVEPFVHAWVEERGRPGRPERARLFAKEIRGPVEQMLRLVVPGFLGRGRPRSTEEPFREQAPRFFAYLRNERGLRDATLALYRHHLRQFECYLATIELHHLDELSPPVLDVFVTDRAGRLATSSRRDLCCVLRVFLRYLHREQLVAKDLSGIIEYAQVYRLASLPRSISWDDLRRTLDSVDRRMPGGRRDYAILLLLATYGLRAREIAALKLDDLDWRAGRLHVPERKAGHSTAFPLSNVVGQAVLEYIQNGRPQNPDRHVFLRVPAPHRPLGHAAISSRASHYLRKAGIDVPRPGSHTLRHTCVQRLVDSGFSLKEIGDYVGHRSPASTQIYGKVAIEALVRSLLATGRKCYETAVERFPQSPGRDH